MCFTFCSHAAIDENMMLLHSAFFLFLFTRKSNCFIVPTNVRKVKLHPLHVKIGFLGFGTIASSIAQGLLDDRSKVKMESLIVSERSVSKSSALKEKFPDVVNVYQDINMIVKDSDILFLCVLPQQAEKVLNGLNFDASRHKLISLVVCASKKIVCKLKVFNVYLILTLHLEVNSNAKGACT